jgi:multidrug efflux system outer membrane protein
MSIRKVHSCVLTSGLVAVFALLPACVTVGPDYEKPQIPTPDAWTQAIAVNADTQPALQSWWIIFNDPMLNDLIQRARESNLDLRVAISRISEARSRLGISKSAELPDITLGGGVSRTRQSDDGEFAQLAPADGFESQSLYEAGFDATWEIDVFGGIRRRVEAAGAEFEATVDEQRDVLVTLLSEVAMNYIAMRSAQQRLQFAAENVASQEHSLELARSRFNSGLTSKLDVAQATSNLGDTRAVIPLLEIRKIQALNRLAVLIGIPAGSLQKEFASVAPIPFPPENELIGLGVPADVLRQRPDIRAAERQLAAQTARVGVATAELYPRFGLSGVIGLQSQNAGNLFSSASEAWSVGLPFQWNVFSGGRIRSDIAVQEERATQAGLQYRQAVLIALEEVENSAVSFSQQQTRFYILRDTVTSSQEAVKLVTVQYETGLTDFNNVLTTQRTLFGQQDKLSVAQAERSLNLVALYKALGGGWNTSVVVPPEK